MPPQIAAAAPVADAVDDGGDRGTFDVEKTARGVEKTGKSVT